MAESGPCQSRARARISVFINAAAETADGINRPRGLAAIVAHCALIDASN